MRNYLTIKDEDNKEIICFKEVPILTIVKNSDSAPELIYHGGVNLTLEGDLVLSVNGTTDLISRGINIDSLYDFFKTTLNLNGRLSKQIINNERSKLHRNKVNKKSNLSNKLYELQSENQKKKSDLIKELRLCHDTAIEEKLKIIESIVLIDNDDNESSIAEMIQEIEV